MYVKKVKDVESTVIGAGQGTSRQVLISPEEGPNFAMRKFVMQPGGDIPAHTNAVEHEQYVLGGRARIGIGDEVYNVEKDDVVFIPAGVPHWYEVDGDEPFEFLCLVPNLEDKIELINK